VDGTLDQAFRKNLQFKRRSAHVRMPAEPTKRILCFSNVYDQNYAQLRAEEIDPCLSSSKRRDLFKCLELATGRELVVMSFPPRPSRRRSAQWLPAVETRFSTHRQFVCANWDLPKLRVPLSWFFYVLQVARKTRSGDIIIIDNYEFVWVLAAYFTRLFHRVSFVLDYEDGKHVIDRSWSRLLSSLAERAGRRLVCAAMLAHPALGRRLPAGVATEMVPGFVVSRKAPSRPSDHEVRFLYSGSFDRTRGVDLLMEALPLLPAAGWRLDISGSGPLEMLVAKVAANPRWQGRVQFHGVLSPDDYQGLVAGSQIGLNCQRSSDPISEVTFPSKVFSYLSAGLTVLSSRASQVDQVCGPACLYYTDETPEALAVAMVGLVRDFASGSAPATVAKAVAKYSVEGTAVRLRGCLTSARLI